MILGLLPDYLPGVKWEGVTADEVLAGIEQLKKRPSDAVVPASQPAAPVSRPS